MNQAWFRLHPEGEYLPQSCPHCVFALCKTTISGLNMAYTQHLHPLLTFGIIWSSSHSALEPLLLDIVRLVDVGLTWCGLGISCDMSRTAQMRVNR